MSTYNSIVKDFEKNLSYALKNPDRELKSWIESIKKSNNNYSSFRDFVYENDEYWDWFEELVYLSINNVVKSNVTKVWNDVIYDGHKEDAFGDMCFDYDLCDSDYSYDQIVSNDKYLIPALTDFIYQDKDFNEFKEDMDAIAEKLIFGNTFN